MSQLPLCIQYIQALGPTFVAFVAASIAGLIAFRQGKTANYKLRFDVYEKRLAIYQATKDPIDAANVHGQLLDRDLLEFYDKIRGTEFLFDGDTRNFIKNIGDKTFMARTDRASLNRSSDHPRAEVLFDREEELLTFLSDQEASLERMFARYLDLSKVGL